MAEVPFELEIATHVRPDGLYVAWHDCDGTGGRLGPFATLEAAETAGIEVIESYRRALGRTVVVKRVRESE